MITASALKIHVWMNFPSHHQSGLFASLLRHGVNLQVTYYEEVSAQRLALGWSANDNGAPWECFLSRVGVTAVERLAQLHDYVHIIPGYGSPLLRELVVAACRQHIAWCHWSEVSRPGWRWWARLLTKMRHARKVNRHALGAFAQGVLARQDFIRWGMAPEKIADLTYSVDFDASAAIAEQSITDFAAGRGVFLFVGRLDHGKAIDVQLQALARLRTEAASWCLVLAGSGDAQPYRKLAVGLGVADQVLFLPPVPWEQIAAIHQAGDVLLLPSRYEGWGAVANEAAASGKALILSTACGAAWHLINPGVNGYLVAAGSADSLAGAMRHYIQGGRALAGVHGKQSRALHEAFTCDRMAQRMLACISGWQGNAAGVPS
jgi:glycosyltransferase involved in cell wall biosynthesis